MCIHVTEDRGDVECLQITPEKEKESKNKVRKRASVGAREAELEMANVSNICFTGISSLIEKRKEGGKRKIYITHHPVLS